MTLPISPVNRDEWLRRFSADGKVAGWRFRIVETSAGVYLAEGSDRFGRLVSRRGVDPDRLLSECQEDARDVQRQLADFPDNEAFYDSVVLLCMDLERPNHHDYGRRVRDAMASGCTAGEVLGAIRKELRDAQADPLLQKSFRPRIARFIEVIDTAFGGADRG